MEKFPKHISTMEKTAAGIFGLLLILSIAVQVFFNGDVLLLIMVLAVCATLLFCLVFIPETYELREDSLTVVNQLTHRSVSIPYDVILHIDTVGTFRSAKRDFDSVEVILKYRPVGMKRIRTISCHPKNVQGFVKSLRGRCANLIPEME